MTTQQHNWYALATRTLLGLLAAPLAWAILFALLALTPAAALAAEKSASDPKGVPRRVEARMFAVFALEELYRDLRFESADIGGPGSTIRHARRARQKLLLARFRQRFEGRRGLKDEELLTILQGAARLFKLNEELCAALDAAEKEAFAPVFTLAKRQQAERQVVAAATVGLFFRAALAPRSRGDDAVRTLIGVSIDEVFRDQKRQDALRTLYADQCKAFDMAAGEAIESYRPKFDPAFDRESKSASAQVTSLAHRLEWKEAVEFDPSWERAKGDLRPGDPFRLLQRTRQRIVAPEFGSRERRTGAARRDAAHDLMKGAALFPQDDSTYNFYRAGLLFQAGTLANESVKQEVGPLGYRGSQKSRPEAASVALRAWNAFIVLEPLDVGSPEALHHFLLAHANSGKGGTQRRPYDIVNNPKNPQVKALFMRSGRPELLYDYARLCAICGEKVQALQFLQLAAQHGFAKFEEAKVCPDLKSLPPDLVESALARGARIYRPKLPKRP